MTYVRLISPTQIQTVPQTWRWPDGSTTSNFHLSPPDVLARAGFLPLVEGAKPTPGPTEIVAPPTYTSDGTQITATYTLAPKPVVQINGETLRSKATTAIDANVTWLAGHATRQAAIDTLKADATAGKSATITTVAQAQTAVRQLSDMVLRCAQGLDQLEATLQAITQQLTGIERLLVDRLDSTNGT